MMTEIALREALASLDVPYLNSPFSEVLKSIEQDAQAVAVTMALHFEFPFPVDTLHDTFDEMLRSHLNEIFPDEVNWSFSFKSQIQPRVSANKIKPFNGVKHIIAISSGKGGVGKSSTSVNLALALKALGANVGLLDADIYGPNLALMLGVPDGTRPEVEKQRYMIPLTAQGIQSMSMSYVTTEETPIVWRGPKASGAFTQLLNTTLWHELDYLLIDMPPGTGDIQLTLGQSIPVNGAVIVTTPQNMATQDAKKGIEMFVKVKVPILGLIENMSTHICSQCGHEEHIFGQGGGALLAESYGYSFLGAIPLSPVIREDCDAGFPTVAKDPDGDIAQHYRDIALQVSASVGKTGQALDQVGIKLVSD